MLLDIYVDGSYFKTKPGFTYGGVVIIGTNVISKRREVLSVRHIKTSIPDLVSANNAGGEVVAALTGIINAASISNGEKCIVTLYYDYTGIKEFLKGGTFVASKPGMLLYVGAVNKVLEENPNIKLKFHKVTAHTGDKYNTLADKLAKGVCPLEYAHLQEDTLTF